MWLPLVIASLPPPPLEAFLSLPTRTALVARANAAHGGVTEVAWLEDMRGRTNIIGARLYANGTFSAPTPLTAYAEDDGMEITRLQFQPSSSPSSSSSSSLLFVRGPSDGANPRHLAVPPTAATFRVAFPAEAASPTRA